jgi:hypothetical protein
MQYQIYILIFIFFGCNNIDKVKVEKEIDLVSSNEMLLFSKDSLSQIGFSKLSKLFLIGGFNGDGKKDSLIQNNISELTNQPIDSIPDMPFDSLQRHFDKLYSRIIITSSNNKFDTLGLGSGKDLFCFINIGDNNNDKKDEIAVVVNNCSFTNICECQIFTLCDNGWKELKLFSIHRGTFLYDTSKTQFNGIKDFLEFRNNRWVYMDYYNWINAETAKDTILKPLRIKSGC